MLGHEGYGSKLYKPHRMLVLVTERLDEEAIKNPISSLLTEMVIDVCNFFPLTFEIFSITLELRCQAWVNGSGLRLLIERYRFDLQRRQSFLIRLLCAIHTSQVLKERD